MDEMKEPPSYAAAWHPVAKFDDALLANHGSSGVLEYYGVSRTVNEDCFYYMMDQFKRFGIYPIPQNDLLSWCWSTALYYIDTYDPYILFDGLTDVVRTNEGYYYQYSLFDDETQRWSDVNAEYIETFKLWPDGAKNWHIMNDHPGLTKHFMGLYDYFIEHFDFIEFESNNQYYDEERALITKYGPKTRDLCHLGIWATIMWMCSQFEAAVAWRNKFHPIFNFCYEEGACVVVDGNHFAGPTHFKRHERAANSCSKCGVVDWCVEIVDQHESVNFLCEHCVSGGERFPSRICGRRMCEQLECPNHPFFKDDEAKKKMRMVNAARRFGPLQQLPNGMEFRALPGYIVSEMKQIAQIGRGVGDRAAGEAYTNILSLIKNRLT